ELELGAVDRRPAGVEKQRYDPLPVDELNVVVVRREDRGVQPERVGDIGLEPELYRVDRLLRERQRPESLRRRVEALIEAARLEAARVAAVDHPAVVERVVDARGAGDLVERLAEAVRIDEERPSVRNRERRQRTRIRRRRRE